ncbi:MAG TPA: hypothetical protein VI424_21120 [Terriglobales bacterium]
MAATRGHSPSFEEAFFLAMSGWGAAAMNSWLQRAGVLANFYGFLLRLSHEMRLQAQNTHISEAVKKNLQKKTRESAGLGCERPCRTNFTAETPRALRKLFLKNLPYDCHSERSRPIGLPIGRRSRRTPAQMAM